jgi:ribose transport system ATP-binding protein
MTVPARLSTRLSISNLDKAFAAPVLIGVNLEIARGEVHAIVGENGAGKSTLVNILAGNLRKDGGEISLDGKIYEPQGPRDSYAAGIACAAQELSSIETLSVAENIALRALPQKKIVIDQRALNAKALRLMQRVGLENVDPTSSTETLSLADRQLLEFAKAISFDCRLLILDEPTAALTAPQADHLHSIVADLAAAGTSIIYISHRLDDVLSVADNVSVLRDGELVVTTATTQTSVPALVEEMTGRNQTTSTERRESASDASVVLDATELTTDDLPHATNLSFKSGEIVGLAGLAGAGRSELLSALFGLVPLTGGTVKRLNDGEEHAVLNAGQAVRNGIAYLGEDRQSMGLFLGQSLLANMMVPGSDETKILQRIDHDREKDDGTRLVEKLSIRCNNLAQDVHQLSGGNQKTALIARWLHRDSDILLLDEPTRGVDVGTKNAIYDLLIGLRQKGKTIIMASSEIDELTTVCDRILVLSDRKLVRSFDRNDFSEQEILAAAFSEFTASVENQSTSGSRAASPQ